VSDFRPTKGQFGEKGVVRKGSKYDKDAKAYNKMHNKKDVGDGMVGINLLAAASLSKHLKDDPNETYERYVKGDGVRSKASKGRKDFPFLKHITKGK
jgi:hypothetical protein